MKKIVINKCYGGFSLSEEGVMYMANLQGIAVWVARDPKFKALGIQTYWTVPPEKRPRMKDDWLGMTDEERREFNEQYAALTISNRPEDRSDKYLVKTVEDLGEKANGKHADLAVVEIPDDVIWEIDEYDGIETVREASRSWG